MVSLRLPCAGENKRSVYSFRDYALFFENENGRGTCYAQSMSYLYLKYF